MIAILDYGSGNTQALLNLYGRAGVAAKLAQNVADLQNSSAIILPGVGSFDIAMNQLRSTGLVDELLVQIHSNQKPLLGICVGMQMLASSSDEGVSAGLNLIPGKVKSLKQIPEVSKLPLPHMGWNTVHPRNACKLFQDSAVGEEFYFLHSFYFLPDSSESIGGVVNYGTEFCCVVQNRNIYGVQFHPEKSHQAGEQLLLNFARLGNA